MDQAFYFAIIIDRISFYFLIVLSFNINFSSHIRK